MFLLESMACSFLDLISKQARLNVPWVAEEIFFLSILMVRTSGHVWSQGRLNAAVSAFLLIKWYVTSRFPFPFFCFFVFLFLFFVFSNYRKRQKITKSCSNQDVWLDVFLRHVYCAAKAFKTQLYWQDGHQKFIVPLNARFCNVDKNSIDRGQTNPELEQWVGFQRK